MAMVIPAGRPSCAELYRFCHWNGGVNGIDSGRKPPANAFPAIEGADLLRYPSNNPCFSAMTPLGGQLSRYNASQQPVEEVQCHDNDNHLLPLELTVPECPGAR